MQYSAEVKNLANQLSGMRLTQIIAAKDEGGAETFFEKFCIAMQELGIQQRIIIGRHQARYEHLSAAGCEVSQVPTRFPMKGAQKLLVYSHLKRWKPDVNFGWMGSGGKLLLRGPWKNVARLGNYYDFKHFATCDHLIGITPKICSYIEDQGFPGEKIHLIPSFGYTHELSQASSPRSCIEEPKKGRYNLLVLGRLHPVKGIDLIIRCMPNLPQCNLLIAGEGQLRSELETLASELNVKDRVHFLGWSRDTSSLMAQADIVAFPSRREANGNVVHEAFSAGVPIIASMTDGPSWLIEDGVDGLLFPIDDQQQLLEGVSPNVS
ncbi:MAG: glycosyl transferase [Candidatus Sedimenticola endophacoides]|nr:MAG: glycosyl transferase [Candidatus Sedimenticola endophacoides]PUE04298.1 MAG: glycosyl transferase [Candidatus Sedimenticola endophacoides]